MALDYDISDSCGNYFEFRIPLANYYKDEGLFFNATSLNNWKGFNDEQYSFRRVEDEVLLYDDNEEKIIEKIPLDEFSIWINNLSKSYTHLDISKPVINILKNIETNNLEIVNIGFN